MKTTELAPAVAPAPAMLSDLDDLLSLEKLFAQDDRISRQSWRRFLSHPGCVWVVRTDDRVVGAAVLLFRKMSSKARLYSIVVHPAETGRGIARHLIAACETEAKARNCTHIGLEVRVSNIRAIRLYESLDFRTRRTLTAYYSDGEDALRMEKNLNIMGAQ